MQLFAKFEKNSTKGVQSHLKFSKIQGGSVSRRSNNCGVGRLENVILQLWG